ncbi:O-antigen ligase family protein [Anaerovorax sp. IOR16]|uniref:O-antigen ligase family protein n=1 Tax=Anaerovorax sp. IOR16 TaxID=2773458 RepID=UPI0019CF9AA7|nr:O-antigen ligase family protein [Anaerovorax sp. IOR16]
MSKNKSTNKRLSRSIPGQEDYLLSMAHSNTTKTPWFLFIPASFFTALIIVIVRMHLYTRPMGQFFWYPGTADVELVDYFSYYKMIAILACSILSLLAIAYQYTTKTLLIKKSFAYLPMGIYSTFVLLSFIVNDYKEFSLLGYNERFEGMLPTLGYMVLLFYIINIISDERAVKWILYPLTSISFLLSFLGISQALGHDFFKSHFGKILITPNEFWNTLDQMEFAFKNNEIYQTIYNINYVSFYLTLLVPLFGMLFIHSMICGKEEVLWKKILWAVLFALLIYNMIGSASSGGLLGLAALGIIGIIILNKRILEWKIPVAILLAITVLLTGITYERWMPELNNTVTHLTSITTNTKESFIAYATDKQQANPETPVACSKKATIDYIETSYNKLSISINGNPLVFQLTSDEAGNLTGMALIDSKENILPLLPVEGEEGVFYIDDERFYEYTKISYANLNSAFYVVLHSSDRIWPFQITSKGILYQNELKKLTPLSKTPSFGFSNNQNFGSGRGYIWSRTIPMIKNTFFIGHGSDTYPIYFPQNDYAGKYNTMFSQNINIVVDKPHNFYLGVAINTGFLSLLALLSLFAIYLVQSARLYFSLKFEKHFLSFVGSGIFFGVCGFLTSALVNDSSVSVMPLFYGLLGTGIAINTILYKE